MLLLCAGLARGEAVPYSFRVEWAALSPEDAARLEPRAIGEPDRVAVIWLVPAPGYHTYAHVPGGDAMPTTASAPGGEFRYPPGEARADIFDSGVITRVYDGETPLFLLTRSDNAPASVALSLLACSDQSCVPVRATLALEPAPASALPEASEASWFPALQGASAADGGGSGNDGSGNDGFDALSRIEPAVQPRAAEASDFAASWAFQPVPIQEGLEVGGLGKALLFGLLAGLVLNVMPCVLPVLTLKMSALLALGGDDRERRQAFRQHNLLFAAGIVTWFAVLAVAFAVAGIAWGRMFQSPAVVFAMLLVVFCLALSLFDVFHLPVLDVSLGAGLNRHPRLQAYTTGVFATLLATPCSGPFLGGVLAWSLTQSLPVLLTVFCATGIGMALPYLVLAWRPSLAQALPRPGPWMLVAERLLGFFLMGTAVYLLSLLPASRHIAVLVVLLTAACAAWAWGRWGSLRAEGGRRALIGALCLGAVGLALIVSMRPGPSALIWQPFDARAFSSQLGKRALLVDFTADWCPTCKVLEHTTLTPDFVAPLAEAYDLALIRVDMTKYDDAAQALLRALKSAGIPLLAVFPPGEAFARPVILRDLYTRTQVEDAVRQALGR